jgi:hypothetical protein
MPIILWGSPRESSGVCDTARRDAAEIFLVPTHERVTDSVVKL